MFEKVLGRGLRLSQCRLDGHRSCDFEAKPTSCSARRHGQGRLTAGPRGHSSTAVPGSRPGRSTRILNRAGD